MAREFTRSEFHALVWSKPITHIAKDFALSDVAIHKICRKHDVPKPPPGWWAKKEAGKPVKQASLPKAGKDMSDRIVVAARELEKEAGAAATAREDARIRVSALPEDDKIKADPIVTRTIEALRRAGPPVKGIVEVSGAGRIRCEIGPDSICRLKRVLTRIVAAAAIQGFTLTEDGRGAHFAGDGETISIAVTEKVDRVKHVPTPGEQKQLDVWEKKRDHQRNRYPDEWRFEMRPTFAEWDYICTGRLGFEMESVYMRDRQPPRSSFRDAKVQRLDAMAADISVALVVLAIAKRDERERREEAERVRLEEKRIRELPLRKEFIADRRREGLDVVLGDLANLDRLRRLLVSLDALQAREASPRVARFVTWARQELAAREDAFSPSGLERRFENNRLFGEDDDHAFKSPFYY